MNIPFAGAKKYPEAEMLSQKLKRWRNRTKGGELLFLTGYLGLGTS
jgi:hypothetical protein